jgi:tRNA1Val (adenine37-N6)-methyltransferase
MSNSYFQFKQFRIDQEGAAMKVSTDACIQGAWTPMTSAVKSVLDIGTGTGLLALMLAQRNETARIDAVEIDHAAARQAAANVAASPWSDRITVDEGDVRSVNNGGYDLIISNPPFFTNDLLGPDNNRNLARHTLSLSFEELFCVIRNGLLATGYASVMLPTAEHRDWEELVGRYGWHITRRLSIVPVLHAPANRVVSLCSALPDADISEELIIRYAPDTYSPEFTQLLAPFYLRL